MIISDTVWLALIPTIIPTLAACGAILTSLKNSDKADANLAKSNEIHAKVSTLQATVDTLSNPTPVIPVIIVDNAKKG